MSTEVNGHKPVGDVPVPLQHEGLLRAMIDTSRKQGNAWSYAIIDPKGGLRDESMLPARTTEWIAPP